ncbi:MAG: hypothetical protein AB8F74_05170 [Saprospiraceae bacterium]
MRLSTILVILFILSLGCNPKIADKTIVADKSQIDSSSKDVLPFPESWVGIWTGVLHIWKGNEIAQSIPMKTRIGLTDKKDEYHWVTTFGDKAETEKPYLLKVIDSKKGHYVIDEQNSIIIESYLFDNKLVSLYSVMGNMIQATFEKRGEELIFEILAGKEEPISITGGTKVGEEEIPKVKTLPFNVMQRAVLTKE